MVRTRNYMPKAQKRLIAIGATVAILAAGGTVAWAVTRPETPAPAPTIAQTTAPAPVITSTPSVGPSAEQTSEPTPSSATPAPPPARVDTSKPEEVAKAWARAYFTRPTGGDTSYLPAIKPYIDPSLTDYLRTDEYNPDGKGYLDNTEGTKVLDVKITPQDGSVGIDTPDRWSRTVTVTVQGLTTGKKTTIPYTLTLFRADKPWYLVSAPKAIKIVD